MRGKSVIVVDRDLGVGALMRLALEAEGYEVQTFTQADAALLAARAAPPHVFIISLVSVHGVNAEICRTLRENPRTAKVSVIICTGRGTNTVSRSIGERPAGDPSPRVLFKPFKLPELLKCVREAVLGGSMRDP